MREGLDYRNVRSEDWGEAEWSCYRSDVWERYHCLFYSLGIPRRVWDLQCVPGCGYFGHGVFVKDTGACQVYLCFRPNNLAPFCNVYSQEYDPKREEYDTAPLALGVELPDFCFTLSELQAALQGVIDRYPVLDFPEAEYSEADYCEAV